MTDRENPAFAGRPTMATRTDGTGSPHFRPGPAEAFAMAYRAIDEGATVVWSNEMAAAWGLVLPLVLTSDVAGGRMAFIERYSRDVDAACKAGRPPVWMVSLGLDPTRRAPALLLAAQAGIPVDALPEVARGGCKVGRTAPDCRDGYGPPKPEDKAALIAVRDKLADGSGYIEKSAGRLKASNSPASESRKSA